VVYPDGRAWELVADKMGVDRTLRTGPGTNGELTVAFDPYLTQRPRTFGAKNRNRQIDAHRGSLSKTRPRRVDNGDLTLPGTAYQKTESRRN